MLCKHHGVVKPDATITHTSHTRAAIASRAPNSISQNSARGSTNRPLNESTHTHTKTTSRTHNVDERKLVIFSFIFRTSIWRTCAVYSIDIGRHYRVWGAMYLNHITIRAYNIVKFEAKCSCILYDMIFFLFGAIMNLKCIHRCAYIDDTYLKNYK